MGGRILALDEGPGDRPLVCVKEIQRIPQFNARRASTVFAGEQLMLPSDGSVGTSTPTNYQFPQWFQDKIGLCLKYHQMKVVSHYDIDVFERRWPFLPLVSVAHAEMVLKAAGHDPIHGYWLQFEGNVPLFDRPDWWVQTEEEEENFNLHGG